MIRLEFLESGSCLDSQSTVDLIMNNNFLKDIHNTMKPLSLLYNSGMTMVNKVGDRTRYGTVWNSIQSPNNVKKRFQGTYDNATNDCFKLHKEDSTKHVSMPLNKGIFYLSVNNNVTLVETIENKVNKRLLESTLVLKIHVHFKTS